MARCRPIHRLVIPGGPSPVRPTKLPKPAIIRTNVFNDGGVAGEKGGEKGDSVRQAKLGDFCRCKSGLGKA